MGWTRQGPVGSYDARVVASARVMGEPRKGERVLGPLEAEVMRIVWEAGEPISVRELLDRINSGRPSRLAYTTVMTVMSRLVEKQALTRQRHGRGYVYEAAVTDTAGLAVRRVMREFGDAAVAQFAEEARADPEVLARLRRLLEDER
jgi:predicted transcriptional regulator